MEQRKLTISFGDSSSLAQIQRVESLTWPEFAALLTTNAPETEDKASAGWYACAEFEPAYRDGENLVARHCLTFDYDEIKPTDVPKIREAFGPYAHAIYRTFSHTAEAPRLRVVFPLSRPASHDEFSAVSRKIADIAGIELAARESHVPAQMMYMPTCKPGGKFKGIVNEGQWIDVDAVLASYQNWTDRSSWPRRQEGDGTHKGEVQCPPNQKPGIVGDFCRAYSVIEAIQEFGLPYAPTQNPDRWTYTQGSTPEGAIIYDDAQKLHSHHNTDPARGQHNSFDLVRLHKFGGQDSAIDGGVGTLPINEHPSFRSMVAFARENPRVTRASALAEFSPVIGPDSGNLVSVRPADPEAKRLLRPIAEVVEHETFTRWIKGLKNIVEESVISILAGQRATYKSFVAVDWAFRAAVEAGPDEAVVVISAEGSDYGRRAKAWLKHHQPKKSIKDVPILLAETRMNFATDDDVDGLVREIESLNVRPIMIVLDTYSKLSGGLDENDNSAVKQFIGRLDRKFKRHFGCTILLVAHTGHSDPTRPRGASAFAADTDEEHISRLQGLEFIFISRERYKGSPVLEPLCYKKHVIDLGYKDEDGEPVTSLALELVELSNASSQGPGKKLTPQLQQCEDVLKRISPVGPIPKSTAVQAVMDAHIADSSPDATEKLRRESAWKVIKRLRDAKRITIHKDGAITFGEFVAIPAEDMDDENE